MHQDDKMLIYNKGNVVFIFNFHPEKSFDGYFIPVPREGKYEVILSSDDGVFGGQGRVDKDYIYKANEAQEGKCGFRCYVPSRCAIVLKKK